MKQNNHSHLSYAFYLLSKRDYGIEEIRDKINAKYDPEETDKVIEKLIEKKFLDDKRFTKNYVKVRKNIKGKYYLKLKLKALKISSELIDEVLAEECTEEEEYESIKAIAEKYLRKKAGEENLSQKAGSFLLRKGFSYETVKKVINDVLNQVNN